MSKNVYSPSMFSRRAIDVTEDQDGLETELRSDDWVNFSREDSNPFDEVKLSPARPRRSASNQPVERPAQFTPDGPSGSLYQAHSYIAQAIYGMTPSNFPASIMTRGRKEKESQQQGASSPPFSFPLRDFLRIPPQSNNDIFSPTDTLSSKPSVVVLHKNSDSGEQERRRGRPPQGQRSPNGFKDEFSPTINRKKRRDREQGIGAVPHPSWTPTERSNSTDEDYDDENSLPLFCPSCTSHPSCRRWTMLAILLVGAMFVFGLLIGPILRGEALTWDNIFTGDSEALTPTVSPVPSASPTATEITFSGQPPSNLTVGAYYYPWYGKDFHGGNYLLEKLLPRLGPVLGEYDDTQPSVIAQHLAWSRQANIRLWVTSWWGPNRLEDNTTKNVILKHDDLGNHKIALLYETTGRVRESTNYTTENVESDMKYICQTYFNHPNYYRIDGRPVLFVYLTRKLEHAEMMEEVILLMKSVADFYGHNLYLVGDHVWQTAPPAADEFFRPFLYLDAMTNYDVYGSMNRTGFAGQDGVDAYYANQKEWFRRAGMEKCGFIPAVSPGYNDRGVRLEASHPPLYRRLTNDDAPGSLFQAALEQARYLVDDKVNRLLLVNSFNEWHEDTQIEPTRGVSTSTPESLTLGEVYSGYGELYLEILRDATIDYAQDTNMTKSDETIVANDGFN